MEPKKIDELNYIISSISEKIKPMIREEMNKKQKFNHIYLLGIIGLMLLVFISSIWINSSLGIIENRAAPNYKNMTMQAGIDIILTAAEEYDNNDIDKSGLISIYENAIDSIFYSYNEKELELTYYQKLDDISRHVAKTNFFSERIKK